MLADPLGETAIWLGSGDGTFLRSKQPEFLGGAIAADVNSDDKPDLISGYGEVLLGNGDGTFLQGQSFNAGYAVVGGLVVADFNRGGKVDIASGCCNSP